jgi:energy-coupling factor transporter transmembrane protein EcfT
LESLKGFIIGCIFVVSVMFFLPTVLVFVLSFFLPGIKAFVGVELLFVLALMLLLIFTFWNYLKDIKEYKQFLASAKRATGTVIEIKEIKNPAWTPRNMTAYCPVYAYEDEKGNKRILDTEKEKESFFWVKQYYFPYNMTTFIGEKRCIYYNDEKQIVEMGYRWAKVRNGLLLGFLIFFLLFVSIFLLKIILSDNPVITGAASFHRAGGVSIPLSEF